MTLFIRQDDQRSRLQEKLAAELRERAKSQAQGYKDEMPDGVEDSQYIKNTKTTSSLAWVWIIVFLVIAGVLVWLTITSMSE